MRGVSVAFPQWNSQVCQSTLHVRKFQRCIFTSDALSVLCFDLQDLNKKTTQTVVLSDISELRGHRPRSSLNPVPEQLMSELKQQAAQMTHAIYAAPESARIPCIISCLFGSIRLAVDLTDIRPNLATVNMKFVGDDQIAHTCPGVAFDHVPPDYATLEQGYQQHTRALHDFTKSPTPATAAAAVKACVTVASFVEAELPRIEKESKQAETAARQASRALVDKWGSKTDAQQTKEHSNTNIIPGTIAAAQTPAQPTQARGQQQPKKNVGAKKRKGKQAGTVGNAKRHKEHRSPGKPGTNAAAGRANKARAAAKKCQQSLHDMTESEQDSDSSSDSDAVAPEEVTGTANATDPADGVDNGDDDDLGTKEARAFKSLHGNAQLKKERIRARDLQARQLLSQVQNFLGEKASLEKMSRLDQSFWAVHADAYDEEIDDTVVAHDAISPQIWLMDQCETALSLIDSVYRSKRTAADHVILVKAKAMSHTYSESIYAAACSALKQTDLHKLMDHLICRISQTAAHFMQQRGCPGCIPPPRVDVLTFDGGNEILKDGFSGQPTTLQQIGKSCLAEAEKRAEQITSSEGNLVKSMLWEALAVMSPTLPQALQAEAVVKNTCWRPEASDTTPQAAPSSSTAKQLHPDLRSYIPLLLQVLHRTTARSFKYSTHHTLPAKAPCVQDILLVLKKHFPQWSQHTHETCSPVQAIRAWQLIQLYKAGKGSKADMIAILQRELYISMIVALEALGVDFSLYTFVPYIHSGTGYLVMIHEDNQHKGKCLVQILRKQTQRACEGDNTALRDGRRLLLLNRMRLLQACAESKNLSNKDAQEELNTIRSILEDSIDTQTVIFKDALLSSPALRCALVKLGYWEDAVILQILGDADMAWDVRGLTSEDRDQRLRYVVDLVQVLTLHWRMDPANMSCARILGVPRNLLLVLAHNACCRAYHRASWPILAPLMVDRAYSQDDVEGHFADIAFPHGFKPDSIVALRMHQHAVVKHLARRREQGLHITRSTKSVYTVFEMEDVRNVDPERAWNSGKLVHLPDEYNHAVAERIKAAARKLPHMRTSVRLFNKPGRKAAAMR